MPCLVRDSRNRSPYWICAYKVGDRRLKKSTKQTDKKKAWEVCLAYVNAEAAIASGSVTEQQMRRVIDDTLIKLGEKRLNDHTVRQQLETWIQSKVGATAERTLVAYRQAKDLFLEFLGPRAERSIRALQKSDVVRFRDQLLAEGRTPETVNKLKKYLSGPFMSAKKEGLVEYNVFAAVDALRTTKVAKDRFTPDQVAAILQACRGTDWEGATLVGYTSDMRLADVANLHWSSIDLEHGLLVFHEEKNNKQLIIGLHPDLEEWITSRPAIPDDPEAPLFPSLAGRSCSGDRGLSTSFQAIMNTAGVKGRILRMGGRNARMVQSLSFHSFRHGAATAVFNKAALREITRRVTGHAARGSLDKYIHEDLDVIREATKLIPRLPRPEE
jgi:integrase